MTSIDATQRNLIVGIVIATLMTLAIVIADLQAWPGPRVVGLLAFLIVRTLISKRTHRNVTQF